MTFCVFFGSEKRYPKPMWKELALGAVVVPGRDGGCLERLDEAVARCFFPVEFAGLHKNVTFWVYSLVRARPSVTIDPETEDRRSRLFHRRAGRFHEGRRDVLAGSGA